ncbi:alpha/beta fold hydrolase [Nocardia terpenica]|uniref:alpha/beta fold hydrolase n=1 Tax=Nocardia terpenica TaxID=455432 RepID=UPI001893E0BE|nr:alpha/beta fold hydrolase [Nocardia terpenica]MBF6062880.1 alpha/beta fold hydrolase [Nocardia terpenica]MBF6104985.1 alpha/beta fold hydrolase [Nocardia terpenica]MBF6112578.1 alpha/beta fold hydrolase [Nocardia terpenica]MBF6118713.1 alpha/beta fold hydrolase [Nocardia terpenica]MBF6154182.1 alpha/beta fold hydrolase [Nocardia terpenica]
MVSEASRPEPNYRAGRGEPVVLLHGLLLTWESWGAVLDELSGDNTVFAPTLPGHRGGPPARHPETLAALTDFVAAAMDENGWRTAHLVGNSLGGWLALELAARGRARSVTAIAPAGMWDSDAQAGARLIRKFRAFAPMIGIGPGGTGHSMVRSLVVPLLAHHPALVPNRLATAVSAAPAHCTIIDDLAEDAALTTGFTRFDDIDAPTTLLFPEHDRVLPPRYHTRATALPTIDARTLPDVGHVPMLDAPTLITTEIRTTIARAERAAAG